MQEIKRGNGARWTRFVIIAAVWVVFTTTFLRQWGGDEHVWARDFGVSAMPGRFADLSQIAAAVESAQHGLNPYLTNPYDMAGRPYIYPRIWLYAFSALKITPHRIEGTGIALASCFLLAVSWLILRQSDDWAALLIGLATTSSATAFAVERGNTDLFVFCLVVVASELAFRRGVWFLVVASVLKVYPFFALLAAAGLGLTTAEGEAIGPAATGRGPAPRGITSRRTALLVAALILGGAGIAIQHQAVSQQDTGVPHGYGFKEIDLLMSRAPGAIQSAFSSHAQIFRVAWDSLLGLLCCSGLASGASWGRKIIASNRSREGTTIVSLIPTGSYPFVLCGAIFAGTFLFSTNYDYRLIFLIPMVPFLVGQLRTGGWRGLRVLPTTALGAILFGVYRGMASRIPWPRLALAIKFASHVDLWALLWIICFFLGWIAVTQHGDGVQGIGSGGQGPLRVGLIKESA